MADKAQWNTPQLIVIGRGAPEENVLAGCKSTIMSSGPSITKNGCYYTPGQSANCKECSAPSSS